MSTLNNASTVLLNRDTGDVSEPAVLTQQMTIMAQGLEDTDEVTLWLVQLSSFDAPQCSCPPGKVTLPQVMSENQLMCCGQPVVLTPEQPFVIVDAPLGWRLRAKWNISVPTTQVVSFRYTNTPNVNDRMRGCPCGGE